MPVLYRIIPVVFLLLWSSAFVAAKLGLPYTEPLTYMGLRFVLVTVIFMAAALILRARWPGSPREAFDIALVGFLIHGIYLSGVFIAISRGMPAGFAALIVGLQPVLTAVLAPRWLGERMVTRQWLGAALGFLGVAMVLWNRLTLEGLDGWGIVVCTFSLIGISTGTIYQKRYCQNMDLVSGSAIQASVAMIMTVAGAFLFEEMTVVWHPEFIAALSWQVLAVSVGAFSLLMLMIRHGEATKVASLLYLVPPTTAVMAFFAFGESLGIIAMLGIAVAAVGVALVVRPVASKL
jgi:drug/metabolite transporter (DMT)-like permease